MRYSRYANPARKDWTICGNRQTDNLPEESGLTQDMVISSNLQAAREIEQKLLIQVANYGYSEADTFAIKLALEESLNNAIRHGNMCDPDKTIAVRFSIDSSRAAITISDQGKGFDPNAVPDPTADENLEKPCGRGIMLMRAYMDEVRYNKKGNEVYMVKRNL